MAESHTQPPLAESEPFLSSQEASLNDIQECTTYVPSVVQTNKIASSKNSKNNVVVNKPIKMSSDIIGDVLGPCGKWQLKAIILIYLTKIPSSWFMACVIFTAPAPYHGEFYCEPSNDSVIVSPHNTTQWIKVAHPFVEDPHDKEFKFDYCNVYEDAHVRADKFLQNKTHTEPWQKATGEVIPCDKFTYRPNYKSVVTQFDLVCSRDVLVAVTQFFHLFGVLWGGIIATKLMEFISPRKLMLLGMIAQIFCGCMTGLVNSFMLHSIFRCMSAICCGQMYTAGGVIFTDITSGKYKTTAVALFEQFWSIGLIFLPGVAHFWSSWSHLYVAISVPTVILIYFYRWIPDSPRWLLKHGLIDEAKEVLIDAANFNGTLNKVPKNLEELLMHETEKEAPPEPNWCSMWENRRTIINLLCCHLAWSIYIVVYYGYLLNIRVYGRQYLEENTIVAAFCEIIGTFIGYGLIMRTTKKWMWTSLLNMFGGLVSYSIWFVPPEIKGSTRIVVLMATSMVAKITVSSTLTILTTCSTELVPNNKKRICGYSTIVWARIWLLCAPFVGAMGYFYGKLVPQTVLGSLTIFGAVITSYIDVPRTFPKKETKTKKGANLPAEIKQEIYTMKL